MKPGQTKLARQYASAMRRYLTPGVPENFQSALRLGRMAVSMRFETLDLARTHEESLVMLGLADGPPSTIKRSERFFQEAITPIIETHRSFLESKLQIKRHSDTIRQRTLELASTNRQLRRAIIQRGTVEAALKKAGDHHESLLKESLQLQEGLRRLARQVLTAQEKQRKKTSGELRDQIGQTLLGINVWLNSLRNEANARKKGLNEDISRTQRLVAKSALSVRRSAREVEKL